MEKSEKAAHSLHISHKTDARKNRRFPAGRSCTALCLAVLLILPIFLTGCMDLDLSKLPQKPRSEEAEHENIAAGEWVLAEDDDDFSGCYIYVFDSPLTDCESFTIDYQVEIKEGGPWDEWDLFVRSQGEWYYIGSLDMEDNRAHEVFNAEEPMDIDAMIPYPSEADEGLGWKDEMTIYDVVQAKAEHKGSTDAKDDADTETRSGSGSSTSSGSVKIEVPKREKDDSDLFDFDLDDISDGTWVDGEWSDNMYQVNDTQTPAFELTDPIENCSRLKVAVTMDMNYNTTCSEWTVYTWDKTYFRAIGDLYLPLGDGDGETEIDLDPAMTISKVVVVPKIAGSYSWSCAIAVADMS